MAEELNPSRLGAPNNINSSWDDLARSSRIHVDKGDLRIPKGETLLDQVNLSTAVIGAKAVGSAIASKAERAIDAVRDLGR